MRHHLLPSRLPVRLRLAAGFTLASLLVLSLSGCFVFWRVQYALDRRLSDDLAAQANALRSALGSAPSAPAAIRSLGRSGDDDQVLAVPSGAVLADGVDLLGRGPLAMASPAPRGSTTSYGDFFSGRGRHFKVVTLPATTAGQPVIGVAAISLDQRDEALGELAVQLAIADGLATLVASAVGYRLARAALAPVERYRSRAAAIARGESALRLEVPPGPADEIRRLGDTLNQMLESLEESGRRQRQFVEDASHDLRTPLAALRAEVEVTLRRPRSATELEAALHRIAADVDAVTELAESLLALSEQTGGSLRSERCEVAGVLDRAAQRGRAQLRTGDRSLHVDCPAGLEVDADEQRLDRALGNLVDNAARHGGGDVVLSAHRAGHDGLAVAVSVHDDGPGMPVEFLPHAAERFRRADRARTGTGTGLGLAVVDAVSTAHRGQLRICSGGHHHHRPTADPRLDAVACNHADSGTTVTILLRAPLAGRATRK